MSDVAEEELAAPTQSPPPPVKELPLSREEYIKKQNDVFQDLTGYSSWSEFSVKEGSETYAFPDAEATSKMLQLYIARIDDSLYTDVENHLNLVRNFELEGSMLKERLTRVMDPNDRLAGIQAGIRSMNNRFRLLNVRFFKLDEQRKKADFLNAELKNKYTLELSKRVRLDHMCRLLTRRLKDMDEQSRKAERTSEAKERALQQRIFELETQLEKERLHRTEESRGISPTTSSSVDKVEDASQEKPSAKTVEEAPSKPDKPDPEGPLAVVERKRTTKPLNDMAGLDARLREIYADVVRLKDVNVPDDTVPDQPAKLLARILTLIESAQAQRNNKAQQLLKAFVDQQEARYDRVLSALETALTERQIILARCDRLELQAQKDRYEIDTLTRRCESLVVKEKMLLNMIRVNEEIMIDEASLRMVDDDEEGTLSRRTVQSMISLKQKLESIKQKMEKARNDCLQNAMSV